MFNIRNIVLYMLHFEREKPGEEFDTEQTATVLTPKTGTNKTMVEQLGDQITNSISRRISKLQNLEKMRVIKNVMHNLYGRHNPIQYKPEFNFQENWQEQVKDNGINKYEVFSNQNHLYMALYSLLCFLFAFSVWFFSVYRLFAIDDIFTPFLAIVFTTIILDGALKQSIVFESLSQNNLSLLSVPLKDYLHLHWKGLMIMVYLGLLVLEEQFLADRYKCIFCLDLCLVWINYQRFKDIYDSIKIKILGSHFRNQIMIFQLFGGCILLVHIFGIVLFLVSLSCPSHNWTNSIENFSSSWFSRYIYSLYFACTTALTVGYGDITPSNLLEIIIVLLVQVFGIINVGYIVNEIGRILSKMSESQELLYKNISEAEKVTQNYRLPGPLATKMKTYIVNNQIASHELNVEEEDHFMRRLNDEIRQQVNSHNHIRIIKSSIFFLCHWSKKFQQHIATKLIRSIYSPQETLPQMQGHERLYILTKGKLSIEASRDKISNHCRKIVQTVVFDPTKDVQFNIYGYTALVSGLNINLKAVAKDYSICYHVDKEDILSTIVEDESDFHYFHQIKSRIEQSRFKQIWEAPNISNTREHYMPNPYYIIQKSRNHLEATSHPHFRNFMIRKAYRSKWYIQASQEPSEQDLDSDQEGSNPTLSNLLNFKNDNAVLSAKERQEKYKAMQNGERAQFLVTNRKYRRKLPRKLQPQQLEVHDEDLKVKMKVLERFQEFKNFKGYFPKFNFSRISERYHQVFGIRMDGSCKSGLTKALENLGEELVVKLMSVHKIGTGQQKS